MLPFYFFFFLRTTNCSLYICDEIFLIVTVASFSLVTLKQYRSVGTTKQYVLFGLPLREKFTRYDKTVNTHTSQKPYEHNINSVCGWVSSTATVRCGSMTKSPYTCTCTCTRLFIIIHTVSTVEVGQKTVVQENAQCARRISKDGRITTRFL